MRIAITGAHGVGKTTLIYLLLKHLNGIEFPKEEMMRIGITGSHGTGKTTLSKLISGRYKYAFLPETPFQALQAGFQINQETSFEATIWIFGKQIEQEQRFPDNWVADKCLIDLLAYAQRFFPDDKPLMKVLWRIVEKSVKAYDLVVYLPTGEFPIEDDGFRSTDMEFQKQIDEQIVQIMRMLGIPYHEVVGTPEERFAAVSELLE